MSNGSTASSGATASPLSAEGLSSIVTNIIGELKALASNPAEKFAALKASTPERFHLLKTFTAPLALISGVGTCLSLLGTSVSLAIVKLVLFPVLTLAVSLAFAFVLAKIVYPKLGVSSATEDQVFALTSYSSSLVAVAGLVSVVPYIGWLVSLIAALHSLYLLYVGFFKLIDPNPGSGLLAGAAFIGTAIVVGVVGAIVQMIVLIPLGIALA